MNIELKAMACLLVYPRQQLFDELEYQWFKMRLLSVTKSRRICPRWLNTFSSSSLANLQGIYVSTFDLGKKASLNLSWTSAWWFPRQRFCNAQSSAPKMRIMWSEVWEQWTTRFPSGDLDSSIRPKFADAQMWLASAAPLIQSINRELKLMNSPWLPVTEALLSIANVKPGESGAYSRRFNSDFRCRMAGSARYLRRRQSGWTAYPICEKVSFFRSIQIKTRTPTLTVGVLTFLRFNFPIYRNKIACLIIQTEAGKRFLYELGRFRLVNACFFSLIVFASRCCEQNVCWRVQSSFCRIL